MSPLLSRLIAISGFLAVLLGALGAHALKGALDARQMSQAWQTAAHYHLAHTVAALALLAWSAARPDHAARLGRIVALWLVGCLLFSGSIYGLALGAGRWLGPITPLGGLAFLAGWAWLAVSAPKFARA